MTWNGMKDTVQHETAKWHEPAWCNGVVTKWQEMTQHNTKWQKSGDVVLCHAPSCVSVHHCASLCAIVHHCMSLRTTLCTIVQRCALLLIVRHWASLWTAVCHRALLCEAVHCCELLFVIECCCSSCVTLFALLALQLNGVLFRCSSDVCGCVG